MNYTKTIEKYGSELWSFNVAGVTFRNKDGEERQEIIESIARNQYTNRKGG